VNYETHISSVFKLRYSIVTLRELINTELIFADEGSKKRILLRKK